MSEDSVYHDADIVWVKLGTSWWPGEVCGLQRQPKGFCELTKRKPYCVVKFFQEESFEYVKTSKHILPFNCSKKDEFIRKGHELFKAKKKFMEKFPSDVSTAERLTRSVTRSSLFFNSRPDSIVKAILGESPSQIECALNGRRCDNITKIINITRNSSDSPSSNSSPTYKCSLCDFQSNRQNVMVLHRKSHSNSTTTANKSSAVNVNDSSMTQQNKQPKLTTKTFNAETFKSEAKKMIKPKQVHKPTNSLLPNDFEAGISDISDNRSEENITRQKENEITKAVLEGCLSPIKNYPTDQGQNTVVNSTENVPKQLIAKNKETCKSEDIQRSFLAEWIDDDEEVLQNWKEKKKETDYQAVSELRIDTKDEELFNQNQVITSKDIQKPFAKIRNIPKKDRRNIVFTDFKNGEDESQQTIDDIPLQKPLGEIVLSIGKHSPIATAECSEKKTTEEIKPITEKAAVNLQITDLSDVRTSTSVNEPNKIDLSFVDSNTVGELDAQPTKTLKPKSLLVDCYSAIPSAEETHIEVPSSGELSTIEPSNSSRCEAPSLKTSLEGSSAEEMSKLILLERQLHFIEAVKTDKHIVGMLPKSEALDVQTPATKPPTKTSTNVQVSTIESSAKEKCTIDQPAQKKSKDELFAESSQVQPMTISSEIPLESPSHSIKPKNVIEERSTIEISKKNTAPKVAVDIPLSPERVIGESIANNQISPNLSGQEKHLLETKEKIIFNETLSNLSISDTSSIKKEDILKPLAGNPIEELIVENLSKNISSDLASKRIEEDFMETIQTNLINENASVVREPNLIHSTVECNMLETSNKTASTSVLPKEPEQLTSTEVSTLSVEQTSAEYANKPPAIELDPAEQSKTTTVNKSSLSCFDFEEEEDTDILTSIAKFKKKYISPEKNSEYGKESQPIISNSQNREMELKDKQLSAEIESLLKTTALSVEFVGPLSSTERTITNEVRGLPIKERGKRIFKSRNRFKIESSSSVTTTTPLQVMQESCASRSTALSSEPCSTKMSTDTEPKETVRKHQNKMELPIDAPSTKDEAMDDKVTNSEEEIVGKVVFSPAEVYAPTADFFFNEFADNREGLVSSSGMGTHIESLPASEKNQKSSDLQSNSSSHNSASQTSSFDNNLETIYVVMKENQVRAADSCIGEIHAGRTTDILPTEKHKDQEEIQNLAKDSVQQDHPNSFFVMEESEPVYEVEIYDADLNNKPNDSNYETSDYDLITTEVKSIVDRIISDDEGEQSEENIESVPVNTDQESSDVVTCIDNAEKVTEITSADNIQLMVESLDPDSLGDSATENSCMVLKHKEERDPSNPDQMDESNSSTTHSKNSYPEKCSHVESFEDESRQTEVDRTEASSDDTSTVISDAEAEFGSPTSMLEEERVFKSGKSEGDSKEEDTNATKVKEHGKIIRKDLRRSRVHLQSYKKEYIKSDQSFDTQGSSVNMFEHKASKLGHNEKTFANVNIKEMKHKITEEFVESKELQLQDVHTEGEPIEKQGTAKTADISEIKQQTSLQEDFLGPISESDSCEEDEEEICSPPIEPLLDESRDEENLISCRNTKSKLEMQDNETEKCQENKKLQTENSEESTQLTNSKNEERIMDFKSALSEKDTKISTGNDQIFALPIQVSSNSENNDKNNSASSTFYTITQKSDTIIKLNKFKEKLNNADSDTRNTESDIMCEKLEIAGEELSAAEALLLIPNQSSNVLDSSKDLLKTERESLQFSSIDDIKEEMFDNIEPISQSLDNKPLDIIRRKRRSHMKVTPRKRILDAQNSDKLTETGSAHVRTKLLKLSPEPEDSLLKQAHGICGTSRHAKTFAEQYEDSFVLKYMKEQSVDDIDLDETLKSTSNVSDKSSISIEKPPQEKVHITVDISNPLSSQIASILGTNRSSVTETVSRVATNKRKQTLEDDIPSFIIKRPNPKTIAEAEAADRETIAQIQNLCPHVEITRKSSRDDLNTTNSPLTQSTKPHIINQQIIRSGNQPAISVTARPPNLEEGIFDISNMPIVLSNETITNEKMHIVQVVKKFQTSAANHGTSSESFIPIAVNKTTPGIPIRRSSSVRTKRTPSRQQLQEQHNQEQQQQTEQNIQVNTCEQQENQQQSLHQQYHSEPHQLQQQHHHLRTQHHPQHQSQMHPQHRQVQLQHDIEQQQFELHHQPHIGKEDQQILIQRHQQQLIFQQQPLQIQQQLTSSGKVSPSNSTDKQMGVDSRGNKYVIIKAPSNTVVMGNINEQNKGQRLQQHQELLDNKVPIVQRNQRQLVGTSKNTVSHQTSLSLHPPHSQSPFSIKCAQQSPQHQLPQVSNQSHLLQSPPHLQNLQIHNSPVQTSETITTISNLITSTTKPKGQGRGRKAKQSNNVEAQVVAKEQTCKNARLNTNGKRSSGSICDIPRQRSTRSTNINNKSMSMVCSDVHQTVGSNFGTPPIYTTTEQQSQAVVYMTCPQSIISPSSPILSCTNNLPHQEQQTSQRRAPPVITGIPIETSDGSGVGYAVPSLPVPGYPQTFLLCELIGKKYREVYPKPLYLSQDRTRFFEVPDELVTEAHRKLTDCRREPNPDVLEVVSAGNQNVLQPRVDISSKTIVSQLEDEQKFQSIDFVEANVTNDVLMQKNESNSIEEEASALLCLQEQISQEQIVQEQFVHEQFAQEHIGHEQLVQEQLVQEQLVQEQIVQEQLAQDQLVQEQLAQSQFVQEQLMQHQIDAEHGILQVATIETEEVQDNIIQHLEPESVVMEESVETTRTMLINLADQQIIVDQNVFFDAVGHENIGILSSDSNTYTLSPEAVQALLNSLYGHRTITSASFGSKVCEQQQIVMNESILQSESPSADILTVALDDSGLYSEEQFINTGDILQIENADDLQLIGNTAENTNIVFQPMTTLMSAKTSETNVLLNQGPKMSTVETPSDNNKSKYVSGHSATATLDDCLNVIGVPVQSPIVPVSLELPTSVTNSAIAAKIKTPVPGSIIAAGVCHHPDVTSLPPINSSEPELHYEFFSPSTGSHNDEAHANEESVVADMGEYTVVSSGGNFDDPGR